MPQILVGDRYLVTERVGKGGMGRVYLAWDTRLRLWCALKVMSRGADPVLRSRFAQEARVMARLSHPNLLRLFDLVDEVESPYMAIEFMEGGALARRLVHGPLAPRTAAQVAADVCGALHVAHEAGVVHRDVKPQNLLLDRSGVVKVADFGVACAFVETNRLTMSNMALGTLAYMPPEQQRDAASVDARADVYAVGATLYSLLTGRRPTGLVAGDREHVLDALPGPLRLLVRRATEPEREDRYLTAAAFEAALRAAIPALEPAGPSALPLVVQPVTLPSKAPTSSIGDVDAAEFEGTARPWRPSGDRAKGASLLRASSLDPDAMRPGTPAPAALEGSEPTPSVSWLRLFVVLGTLAGSVTCVGVCAGGLAGGLGRLLLGP